MLDSEPEQTLSAMLESALGRGFLPPFHLVTVGSNGEMVYARYVPAQDGAGWISNILARHSEPPGFQAPINLILVDSRGEVMGATIRTRSNGPSLN
jgi:hypothetical protein